METPARKERRRRVLIACSSCRARKTKCDAQKPTCSTCAAAGEVCDYSSQGGVHNSNKVLVSKDYLHSIEQRLGQLERRAVTSSGRSRGSSSTPHLDSSSPTSSSHGLTPPVPVPQSPSTTSSTGSALLAADPNVFLGGDSGVFFTQLILNAMNGRDADKLQTQPFSQQRIDTTPPSGMDIFIVPPDAQDLIHRFFDFHFILSPIFHEPTIRASFDRVLEGDIAYREQNRYTLAMMNMIFAMTTSHRRSPRAPSLAASRFFYNTAMALVQPTLLLDWSLEKVQILLLGARYLQSSNSPDECWNILGLAIRVAYGLELHLPPPDDMDCITKEVRKRTWFACFCLDKLLSMIYGRPATTSTSTFTTPLPEDLDDDCIQVSRILYPARHQPSTMSFSIHVAKLYRVMESADRLSGLGKMSWDKLATIIFSLDEEFEDWLRDLPEHLKLRGDGKEESDQALILALRANMVRILIHRQSLALTLSFLSGKGSENRRNEGLKNTMFRYSRDICVQTAMETIRLVGLRHDQTAEAVGPSWFNLYYLFNAILVVVSHVVDPHHRDDKMALRRLDEAMSMINRMSISQACAQRAYLFLQQLLSYMDKSLLLEHHPPRLASTQTQHQQYANIQQQQQQHDAFGMQGSIQPVQHPPFNLASGMVDQAAAASAYDVDFFALLDVTQDLAENLGSQLESSAGMEPSYVGLDGSYGAWGSGTYGGRGNGWDGGWGGRLWWCWVGLLGAQGIRAKTVNLSGWE